MLNKLVLCSLYLFIITTSLLAEINFKFKENIDPVIVSNNSWNYSWTLQYDVCSKGLAEIFQYKNNVYITALDNHNSRITIKKLNKNTNKLDDFKDIELNDQIFTTNENSDLVIPGSVVLLQHNNNGYIVFFYTNTSGQLGIIKICLDTGIVERNYSRTNAQLVLEAIPHIASTNSGEAYVLYRRFSDVSQYLVDRYSLQSNRAVSVVSLKKAPEAYSAKRVIYYNTLMWFNDKLCASGFFYNHNGNRVFMRCDIRFNNNYDPIIPTEKFPLDGTTASYVYTGGATRSVSYKTDKYYTYTIRTNNKSHPDNGIYMYDDRYDETIKFIQNAKTIGKHVCGDNNRYAYVTGLYIDDSGFYTGEINTQQYNKITIHKRTIQDAQTIAVVGAYKTYYDDNIIREFKQVNSMARVIIGDTEYMLTLASGYGYDSSVKTVLYFIPIIDSPVYTFFKKDGLKNSVLYPLKYTNNEGQYSYKFVYTNYQNQPPSETPRLFIYKNGKPTKVDGILMDKDRGDINYTDGVVYTYMTTPSDIPKMNPNDKYTYQIRVGEYISQMYDGPFYFTPGEIKISAYEGSYITPQEISPSSDISVQITVIGTDGIKLASEYPRVMIYRSEDLVNPIEIKGSTYTVLSPIEGSDNGYRASIGRLPTGNYTCKISVRNEYGVEKEVISNFICSLTNEITEYEGSYITPISDINPTKEIFFQMTYRGTDGIKLASEYPRVMVYKSEDLVNPIEIKGSTYTVLSPIEGSDNGYRAGIGRLPKGNYKYQLVTRNEYGNEKEVIADFSVASLDTSICYNAPNPFNPNKVKTKIRFNVNNDEIVNIKIYTLDSKLVFEDSYLAKAGTNDYEYRGKDDKGNTLYNGVYLCIIDKQGGKVKCKIAIVK